MSTEALVTVADTLAKVTGRFPTDQLRYEILGDCEPLIIEGVIDNFENAATAAGVPWPPHAPATVKRYGPHPLLILSGAMREAATGGGTGHVREIVDDDTLELGVDISEIPYAAVHQYGYPEGNIPQREYLAMSTGTIDACATVAADHSVRWLMDELDKAGLDRLATVNG